MKNGTSHCKYNNCACFPTVDDNVNKNTTLKANLLQRDWHHKWNHSSEKFTCHIVGISEGLWKRRLELAPVPPCWQCEVVSHRKMLSSSHRRADRTSTCWWASSSVITDVYQRISVRLSSSGVCKWRLGFHCHFQSREYVVLCARRRHSPVSVVMWIALLLVDVCQIFP